MGVGAKIVSLLIFLSCMYIIGSLIFAKGFLLKRVVVERNSSCHSDFAEYFDGHGGEGCWLHRRFNKAIVIVIDALRFDFMEPLPSSKAGDKPFLNKLSSIHSLLSGKPQNSRLYKFIADPPTTTLQRLKGLTTGSLPTFVEAGSNFASGEITEDNVIDQLVKKGKEIVFMGDDTWMGLFPGRFTRAYPFPSFNVKDLHTVDNGVLDHLYKEQKLSDWDLLIAHFLGVDHCGHRYGPNHPAMADKLAQMDLVIRNVTRRMNDDTILFVLGDHGMTSTGDHGGDSADEVTAGLFVYSPQQITSSKYIQGEYKTISQTDLVPTLSLLLGTPIPFSNLGKVITDLLNYCSWTKESHIKQVFHTVQSLRLNAQQISQYLESYISIASDFSLERYTHLQELLSTSEQNLQDLVTEMFVKGNSEDAHGKLHELEGQYIYFIDEVRKMCQDVWAKFDMTSIFLGLLTMLVAIMVNVFMLSLDTAVAKGQNIGSALIVVFASVFYIGYAVFQTIYLESESLSFMAFILGVIDIGAVFVTMNIMTKKRNMKGGASKTFKFKLKNLPVEKIMSVFFVIILIGCLFSNSFVVYDDSVSSFLAQSLIWILCVRTIQMFLQEKNSIKEHPGRKQVSPRGPFDILRMLTHPVSIILYLSTGCSMCVRLAKNFRSCREEQVNCTLSMFLHPLTALGDTVEGSRNLRYFISVACLFICVFLTRAWLKHYGNINSASPATMCVRYLFPIIAACCSGHWAMQGLPQQVLDSLPVFQQIVLPQCVYLLVLVSIAAIVLTPLLKLVVSDTKEGKDFTMPLTRSTTDLVQKVYNHVKLNWREHLSERSQEQSQKSPVVYGLATIFSAGIVYTATVMLLLMSLLLGDGMAPSLLCAVLAAFFLLELLTVRSKWCKDTTELLLPGAVMINLLSNVFFYATGHQATIPSIRFETAFTGFLGDFNFYALPAVLIHLNTFASEVFFTVISPLLILWPCTRGVIAPYVPAQSDPKGQWKGDFTLFEDKDKFRSLLLRLFSTLFLLNSLKLCGALCAAAVHRRHLMVWKIFAPRFVFTAMSTFSVFGVSVLVLLLLLRMDISLEHWALKLEKE